MPDPPQCIQGLGASSSWQSRSLHLPVFPLMGFPARNSRLFSQTLSTCLPAGSFLWWLYCFPMATLGQSRCSVNTEPRISKLDHINGFEVFFLHILVFSFLPPFLSSGINGSLSDHKLQQEVSSPSGARIGLRGLSRVEAISTLTSVTLLQ